MKGVIITDDVKFNKREIRLIRWWEDKRSRVRLSCKLRNLLVSKRKEMRLTQKSISLKLRVKENNISFWENSRRSPRVEILMKWLNCLGIPLSEVENEISLFRAPNDNFSISNFPVEEKPEHIEIIAHVFFDGTFGHGKSFLYESPNMIEQEMFKRLLESSGFKDSVYKNRCGKSTFYGLSSVTSNLLLNHYRIKNRFFSEKVIMYATNMKKWRNAILRACFIDEGSVGKKKVRDNLMLASSLKNDILVKQILELSDIDYSCNLCVDYDRKESTILMHNVSLLDFYIDNFMSVPNEYYKKINIEKMIRRLEPSKLKW